MRESHEAGRHPPEKLNVPGLFFDMVRENILNPLKKSIGVSRPTIYKCIDKAIAAGPEYGLKDLFHSPKKPEITEEIMAWVVNLACAKPEELGYAAEVW